MYRQTENEQRVIRKVSLSVQLRQTKLIPFFIHENMKSQFSVWKGTFQQPVTRGFAGTVFMFADETTWLEFPYKRQNNYIIFLFICSELYICRHGTVIASVISRKISWTLSVVILNMCVWILCPKPLELLNTYFSCLALFLSNIYKVNTLLS